MAELRWILLGAGLLFLAAIAAWEMRRPRQARRESDAHGERSEPAIGNMGSEPAVPSPAIRNRTPAPPVIDLPEMPMLADEPSAAAVDLALSIEPDQSERLQPDPAPAMIEPSCGESVSASVATEQPLPTELPPLIVEWPPENERHIIALRVVGSGEERLSGRSLRQALAACGFVHGRFGIFHQPGIDGRALLSAASLSKPGVFDPASMDFNRFTGLSLFAVVPGPLPAAAALDHLLDSAHDLASRLRGRVQDEQGLALDAVCMERLRRTVQSLPPEAMRAEPAA